TGRARLLLQRGERVSRPPQGFGDPLRIAGDLLAPPGVQRLDQAAPAVQRLGQAEELDGEVDEAHACCVRHTGSRGSACLLGTLARQPAPPAAPARCDGYAGAYSATMTGRLPAPNALPFGTRADGDFGQPCGARRLPWEDHLGGLG